MLFGNVWRALSPWRAIADGFVWARLRLGGKPAKVEAYPQRLGRWPAAVALFAFVSLELAYKDPAAPLTLAWAIAIYTVVTLFGYATFGRETWHARGEGFAVAFGYLARMAPLTAIDGRLRFRWPFTGLAGDEPVPGSLAVIAVMLGSVAFDGVSRTSHWQNVIADVKDPFIPDSIGTGELLAMLVNLGALLGVLPLRRARLPGVLRGDAGVGRGRALARAGVPAQPRADRVRLRARALLLASVTQGQYVMAAAVGPVRPRLGPASARPTTGPTSRSSRRTRSGTSRRARSSPATSSASPSPTTERSRCSRTAAARCARSTRCSR